MKLAHHKLTDLLQKAYSAEKAAAFAYQGHAASVRQSDQKAAIRQIELDEWNHRKEVLAIMRQYDILYEMGMKEKEHEVYFLGNIKNNKLLPVFEKVFDWGGRKSFNDVNLEEKYPMEISERYCRK